MVRKSSPTPTGLCYSISRSEERREGPSLAAQDLLGGHDAAVERLLEHRDPREVRVGGEQGPDRGQGRGAGRTPDEPGHGADHGVTPAPGVDAPHLALEP